MPTVIAFIVVVYTQRSIIYNSFRCNSRRNRASIYASKQRAVDMETLICGRPSRPGIVSAYVSVQDLAVTDENRAERSPRPTWDGLDAVEGERRRGIGEGGVRRRILHGDRCSVRSAARCRTRRSSTSLAAQFLIKVSLLHSASTSTLNWSWLDSADARKKSLVTRLY